MSLVEITKSVIEIFGMNFCFITNHNFQTICTLNKREINKFNVFAMVTKTNIVILWNVLVY